jgi:hypothetical protein
LRVLVVGSYPPPESREAHRTLETVHRLGTQGDEVEVLSAPESAANVCGPITGPRGALQTLRKGRHYDSVVVQVEQNTPLRTIHGVRARVNRVLDCLFWGLALRCLRDVTFVVTDIQVVHGSVGGRTGRFLWTSADRLLVASEYARARLVEEGGADAARVEIMGPLPDIGRHDDHEWATLTDAPAIMDEVRRRSAADRRAVRRGEFETGF